MDNEGINFEPVFTSTMPANDTPVQEENNEPEDNSARAITLERYGSSVGSGWHGLIAPIFTEINLYNKENPHHEMAIGQIKEKFGTLRIHTTWGADYIQGMIEIAEEESAHICEECGARGELVQIDGWWKTLCKRHITAKKKSNHNYDLFRKLYRAAADTYMQNRWNGGLEDVLLRRMKKENWFTAKTIAGGKIRLFKLERGNKRSSFYIRKGKEYVKHKINVQWVENEDKSLHEGYWYVINGNEKVSFGMIERKLAEKASVKEILSHLEKTKEKQRSKK